MKAKVQSTKNIIQSQNKKMEKLISIIAFGLIVALWNYIPYSYLCYDYPLTGCDKSDFWWNIPFDWESYKGIRWGSYFIVNSIVTFLIISIYGKITQKK